MKEKRGDSGEGKDIERLKAAGKLIDEGDLDGGLFQLRRLKQGGYNEAAILLAQLYETGSLGVERDITTALKIYQQLVDEGDPLAILRLGQLYFLGENIQQDYDLAFYYYSILANAGDATAQFVLGDMYQRGLHTQRDLIAARRWFNSASDKGHMYAARNIAALDCLDGRWLKGLPRVLFWNFTIMVMRVIRPYSQKLTRI
jgi:TPR repeat protein